MAGANGYQDLNALLRTLSAYVPPSQTSTPYPSSFNQQNAYGQQPGQYMNGECETWHQAASVYSSQGEDIQNIQSNQGSYVTHKSDNAYRVGPDYGSTPFDLHHLYVLPQNNAQSEASKYLPSGATMQLQPESLSRQSTSLEPFSAPAPPLDLRTITSWPSALRHVTKLAARNETLGISIRKLIANQHENERQWWTSRQALLEKQAARVEGRRKLDEVMRSVGATLTADTSVMNDVAELKLFDVKIHRAAVKMMKAMSAELEVLGIPFFGTSSALVSSKADTKVSNEENGTGRSEKGISEAELQRMQRKMIQHLEDLYKE